MAIDVNSLGSGAAAGGMLGLFAGLVVVGILIAIALYIYFAFAGMTIARKLKYKWPWLAWIPFANVAMWLQLGGFHWAWVFLVLLSFIPYVGSIPLGILLIISHWRVFEKFKYPGWLSLIIVLWFIPPISFLGLIGYGIIIGIVAWGKEHKITPVKKAPRKRKK